MSGLKCLTDVPTMPNVVGTDCWQAVQVLIDAQIAPNIFLLQSAPRPADFDYFGDWPVTFKYVTTKRAQSGFVLEQIPAAGTSGVAYLAAVTLTLESFPFGVADRFTRGGYS